MVCSLARRPPPSRASSRSLSSALVGLLLGACMGTPLDDGAVVSTGASVLFQGFVLDPSAEIQLQASSSRRGRFATFATATSSASPLTMADGTQLYTWSVRAVIPTWVPGCGGLESYVRARSTAGGGPTYSLLTYDEPQEGESTPTECVLDALDDGASTLEALYACRSEQSGVIRVMAPGAGIAPVHAGDVVVSTQAEADAFACVQQIDGSLTVGDSVELELALPHLQEVTGDVTLAFPREAGGGAVLPDLRSIDLHSLTTIGGDLSITYLGAGNDVISLDVGLDAVTSIGGDLSITLLDNFNSDLDGLGALASLGGDLSIAGGGGDAAWAGLLPSLAQVSGDVDLYAGHNTFGALEGLLSVGGDLAITGCYWNPGQLVLAELQSVGGDVTLLDVDIPAAMGGGHQLPSLATIGGALDVEDAAQMQSLSLGDASGLTVGALRVHACGQLETLDAAHVTLIGAGDLELTSNPLLSTCDAEAFVAAQVSSGWTGEATVTGNGGC